MIQNVVRGDILLSGRKHILFGVNTEGYNDAGFAGMIARRYLPQIANTGPMNLGDKLEFEAEGKTFHALVCHSLGVDGWTNAPRVIEETLNRIQLPAGEMLASIAMGSGLIGKMQGADPIEILGALHRSKPPIELYVLFGFGFIDQASIHRNGLNSLSSGAKALLF
jgi:hypothetical protein